MEYERPRQSARSFGLGLLSGGLLAQGDVVEKLQSNLNFRIQSAREMLSGDFGQEGASPLKRRQELRNRRMEILQGDGSDQSQSGSSTRGTSGSIGTSGTSDSGNSVSNKQSGPPTMSEANAGTKKRAQEHGFGN